MNTVDILRAARELIQDPDHWCQGHGAHDHDGKLVGWDDPNAMRRCAVGALSFAAGPGLAFPYLEACNALCAAAGFNAIEYNDSHSHNQVLAMYDKAIAAEDKKLRKTDISSLTALLDKPIPALQAA